MTATVARPPDPPAPPAPASHDAAEDARLLADAAALMRELRRRARGDFMDALGFLLGVAILVLVAFAVLAGEGRLAELSANLAVEVLGVWLTVILIDGLWRRLERGSERELDQIAQHLDARRGRPLSDEERQTWRRLVEAYRDLAPGFNSRNPVRRFATALLAVVRLVPLRRQGNRTFEAIERELGIAGTLPGADRHPSG